MVAAVNPHKCLKVGGLAELGELPGVGSGHRGERVAGWRAALAGGGGGQGEWEWPGGS